MTIVYTTKQALKVEEFIDILNRSTLGERRPVEDTECIQGMLDHADILALALEDDKIVGVARVVTDYHYVCYLSDLAVDKKYQKMGIGKRLIETAQAELKESCKIILLCAPDAVGYYPKIGFSKHNSAWTLTK